MMSSAKDELYSRTETIRSMFSNHHEIHSFGYGFLGWLLPNAAPTLEPFGKAAVLMFVATLYGFDWGERALNGYLGFSIERKNIPIDIRKQKHYFVLGAAAAYGAEYIVPKLIPLLV